jgi:hypothetical protein
MRLAIAAVFLVWAAVFAAVVVEGHSLESTTAPASTMTRQMQNWAVLQHTPLGWRAVRGPFAGAEACLHVSDTLNNQNPKEVFDCDEAPNAGAAAAGLNAHTPQRR